MQTGRICQGQSHESSIPSRTQSRTDRTCSCSTRPFCISYPQHWYGERTRWRHCSACSAVQCHSTGDRLDCGENRRSYRASSRSFKRSIDGSIVMASMQTSSSGRVGNVVVFVMTWPASIAVTREYCHLHVPTKLPIRLRAQIWRVSSHDLCITRGK